MPEVKSDRVNRRNGTVVLNINCPYRPGQVVKFRKLKESPINCAIRDANAMDPESAPVGYATFDANTDTDNVCDANLIDTP